MISARPRSRATDIDRRRVLAALAAAPFLSRASRARAETARRIVALDWGLAETLIALGAPLVGMAEVPGYNRTVETPRAPDGVVDVGLRLSPNAELMRELAPDLIMINSAQLYMRPSLERFGAVRSFEIYAPGNEPFARSQEAATELGAVAGREDAAKALLRDADRTIAAARADLSRYDGRPLYVFGVLDSGHINIFGVGSLFQGVLDRLGLRNAWQGQGGYWGNAVVGVEQLADDPSARFVRFGAAPVSAKSLLNGRLWAALAPVRAGRVVELPPLWAFGALPSAMRFASLIGRRLGEPAP